MLPSRSRSRPPPILLPFLPLAVPSPSLSLSLSPTTLVHNRSTRLRRSQCARARMHGATTTPMHFRTHTRSRSRALSTDCDHCRSSTIPRLVPLALPPPPLAVAPFPHSSRSLALARSPTHNFLSLANFSCLFRIALSPSSPPPAAFLFLQRWIYLPAPHPHPPLLLQNTSLLHHTVHPPPSFLSVHRFPRALAPSYILFPDSVLFLSLLSFPSGLLPSLPSVSLSTALLRHWHTGQPARFTVRHSFATLVPSLLLSPSFTRAQRTRCSRTGARECNV